MPGYESKEQLYDVLNETIDDLKEDEAFLKRIASANSSLAFRVTDLDAEYIIAFSNGEVEGSAGGAGGATVIVDVSSDTLDKMLRGQLSGESAYFSGALRLRGDEWIAQSMASYVRYMTPYYKEAAPDAQ